MKEYLFAQPEWNDGEEAALYRVLRSKWLAAGPACTSFEQQMAKRVGRLHGISCNSGSSGLLLALASLQLPKGSKVVTSACGFPATLNPILHLGYEPVFVDYELPSHNADLEQTLAAFHVPGVRAAILAHTLGNPLDMVRLQQEAEALDIVLIEDCCEAAGSLLNGQSVGSFTPLSVFSFYPSHQITALGGGGMVLTNDPLLASRMRSLRDWGKVVAEDYQLGENQTTYSGELSYYPGYTYTSIGYNLKLPDANAAFGEMQLLKLGRFAHQRQVNFELLYSKLAKLSWTIPVRSLQDTRPAWFGYPITLAEGSRDKLGTYLESVGIRHRPFFAGNILRHAPYAHLGNPDLFPVADKLMKDSLFIGCWQGLSQDDLTDMIRLVSAWSPSSS